MRIKVDITGFGDDLNKKQELNGDDARFDRCYLILETYHRDTNHKITFNDSNLVLLYGTINFEMITLLFQGSHIILFVYHFCLQKAVIIIAECYFLVLNVV